MKKMKYVIASYRVQAGGIIVLHNLCRILNELGQDAKIMYFYDFDYHEENRVKFWLNWFKYNIRISIKSVMEHFLDPEHLRGHMDISMKGIRRKYTPFINKNNTIAVYSEAMFGNPLRAEKVVRWLLYFNSKYEQQGDKTIGYDKNDLFFAYREVFNDPALNPDCRICYAPYTDLDKYKRYNFGERSGKCYILRKGAWRVKAEDCADGIIIDDLTEREKVRVFNESEYCISYDTQTAYSSIAAMCGCISVVVPEKGKTRDDYLDKGESAYGVAYGFGDSEIQYAINTREKVFDTYLNQNTEGEAQVLKFIETCESYFNQQQ